jgi:hypothetical protein
LPESRPPAPSATRAATTDQLARIAEIAADPVGPPEQAQIREKYLGRQMKLANTRSRAESNEHLLKHRVV